MVVYNHRASELNAYSNGQRNGHHAPSRSPVRRPFPPRNTPTPPPTSTVRDVRCIKVSGLNLQTIAPTVREAFARWGNVEKVELGLDGNDSPNGTAIVLFKEKPWSLDFLSHAVVERRNVKIEVVNESLLNAGRVFRDSRRSHYTRVPARSLSLGVMKNPKTFVEEWCTDDSVAMIIQYDRRQIQFFFNSSREKYKLEFSFKDMTNGELLMERDGPSTYFTIQLKFPARFWRSNQSAVHDTKLVATVGNQWERILTIPVRAGSSSSAGSSGRKAPVNLHPDTGKARLGMWTTYRIKFAPERRAQKLFEEMLVEASEYNLVPRDTRLLLPILSVVRPSSLPTPRLHNDRAQILSFEVLYMLESLILSYQFGEYNLDDEFYETIKELDPQIAIGIFDILWASKQRAWEPLQAIKRIFNEMGVKVRHRRRIPEHCAMIRKILVTPTTVYVQPPSIETTNRVVRHYREHADRFVRVQFLDDGMSKVSASHQKTGSDAIYKRIYKALQSGIQIGTRRYDFLAFSSSQLRDHGCWFFAPTKDLSANKIRNWMGSFRKEKIVAKHAVRMGQCFSSTRRITELEHDEVKYIDDIVRNGYTFSDGVGTISRVLAEQVANAMDLNYVPSAFQFRFGGAKGVLSKSSTNLKSRSIQLRPSQIKFESNHYELEIIRVSTLIPAYLNRQAITILSTLGVPDDIFMKKMQSMIDKMNRMLGDPADAIKTLLSNIDEFGTTQAMAKMIQAGFLEKRDPYIANLINMFRVSQLKDLKKKAKVHVPKGAFLLGVMDETMTLQEGEVFCQISGKSNKGRSKRTIQGDVVVYRNPCFHPGDIRVVKAVDNPKLHHLTDVLVFSAQGFRDVPSMLSGGDLDGDDYTIFWDEELFPKIRNYEPMDYNAEDPVRVDEVKLIDIQKFYVNYINSDNLGTIANSHLATADRSQKGALDGACLRLAQKHSLAVDFPKTGKPAKVEEDLRVHVYPDFMEKKDKESYESQKVLGKMYRAIDKSDYREYQSHLVDNTVYDVRLRVPDMERYIQEARKLKGEYGRDLLALMNQYGVQTESEIVSGYIVKWLKKSNKKSMHEIHKQTMGSVLSMRKVWRDRFEQGLEDKPGARHAKAAAWYYVAYHPDERIKDFSDEGRFLSFPWVLVDIICEIAIMNNDRVPAEDQAKPVDDALVKRLAASQNSIKISMIYSSDDEDDETDITDDEDENEDDEDEEEQEQKQEVGEKSDDNDEDDDEDDEDNTAIKSFVLSAKPQIQDSPAHTTSPVPQHNNTFTTLGANATEEELANALLN